MVTIRLYSVRQFVRIKHFCLQQCPGADACGRPCCLRDEKSSDSLSTQQKPGISPTYQTDAEQSPNSLHKHVLLTTVERNASSLVTTAAYL